MPFDRLTLAVGQPDYPPWEWQLDEPSRAYSRFLLYRDMPYWARSTTVVAHRIGVSPRTIEKQASAYRWVERAREWDRELLLRMRGHPPWKERIERQIRRRRDEIERLLERHG